MDILQQIERERVAKAQIAEVYPPEQVESQFGVLIDRKRKMAMRTSETVLMIIKEMQSGFNAAQ